VLERCRPTLPDLGRDGRAGLAQLVMPPTHAAARRRGPVGRAADPGTGRSRLITMGEDGVQRRATELNQPLTAHHPKLLQRNDLSRIRGQHDRLGQALLAALDNVRRQARAPARSTSALRSFRETQRASEPANAGEVATMVAKAVRSWAGIELRRPKCGSITTSRARFLCCACGPDPIEQGDGQSAEERSRIHRPGPTARWRAAVSSVRGAFEKSSKGQKRGSSSRAGPPAWALAGSDGSRYEAFFSTKTEGHDGHRPHIAGRLFDAPGVGCRRRNI